MVLHQECCGTINNYYAVDCTVIRQETKALCLLDILDRVDPGGL